MVPTSGYSIDSWKTVAEIRTDPVLYKRESASTAPLDAGRRRFRSTVMPASAYSRLDATFGRKPPRIVERKCVRQGNPIPSRTDQFKRANAHVFTADRYLPDFFQPIPAAQVFHGGGGNKRVSAILFVELFQTCRGIHGVTMHGI